MEIVEQILKSNYVSVPKLILHEIARTFDRKERFEAAIRMWRLLESCFWSQSNGRVADNRKYSEWAVIPDKVFRQVVSSHGTKNSIKKFFREKGIVSIRQWKVRGESKDMMVPNEIAKAYRLRNEWRGNPIRVPINGRFNENTWSWVTPEKLCNATKKNLNLLSLREAKFEQFLMKDLLATKETKLERIESAIKTVHFRNGCITRGRNVKRLYSPWTSMPKVARRLFALDGESMVEFDLSCSQPTLIAEMIHDSNLMDACFHQHLYPLIIKRFNCVDKDEAKKLLFLYLYGPNREPHHNVQAVAVQDFFFDEFPSAAKEIWKRKTPNHRAFNRRLQNLEARIFVDGAFRELINLNVPCLTIHDCLCVKKSNAEQCLEVLMHHLNKSIPSRRFNLSRIDFETEEETSISGINPYQTQHEQQ